MMRYVLLLLALILCSCRKHVGTGVWCCGSGYSGDAGFYTDLAPFGNFATWPYAAETITVAGKEYRLEFVTKVTQACELERNCRGPKYGNFVEVYRGAHNVTEVRLIDPALAADHAKATEYVRKVIESWPTI